MTGPAVLFICTGNTCRSPMAEALFRGRLSEWAADAAQWRVGSAGIRAAAGQPAARNAQTVLAQRGLDVSTHRAALLDEDLLEQFDLILTMEPEQAVGLRSMFPTRAQQIFLLAELLGSSEAVPDPFGGELAVYQQVMEQLDAMLVRAGPQIVAQARALQNRKQ